jgi:patatin-like phospholipase/acyl hydrolase
MKRLLSIQGGGIRGIIPCLALAALEKQTGKLTRDIFDFVGGTSTGALLTATIVAGIPATTSLETYTTSGPKIFSPTNSLERKAKLILSGNMFDNKVLHQVVVETLGAQAGMTINDSPIGMMITAGNMLGDPWYFVRDAPTNAGTTGKAPLVDAAVASACATTYQAPWLIPGFGYFADGGTVSLADPVYQLCVEAFNTKDCYGDIDPAEALVISLGTGTYTPPTIPPPPGDLLSGISWVTGSLVSSSKSLAEQATDRQWPGIRQTFNAPLPSDIDEADVNSIPLLVQIGTTAAEALDWATILKL